MNAKDQWEFKAFGIGWLRKKKGPISAKCTTVAGSSSDITSLVEEKTTHMDHISHLSLILMNFIKFQTYFPPLFEFIVLYFFNQLLFFPAKSLVLQIFFSVRHLHHLSKWNRNLTTKFLAKKRENFRYKYNKTNITLTICIQ